jgi:sugar-specific transcriptional regulator TrmB
MDESLTKLFTETKLTDKQIRVYLALLHAGQASVTKIAAISQLKRPNTYVIIAELEAMGYVYPVVGSSTKTYAATDPNKVVSDVKQGIQDLEEMLPYLRAIQKRSGRPHVQYYEGVAGVQQAFAQIYRPKDARYVFSLDDVQAKIPTELERWRKRYFAGKARSGGKHLIRKQNVHKDYVASLKKNGQVVRCLPPEINFNIDIALMDGSVYLTSFEDNVYVTVINSQSIYQGLCALYDLIWSISQEDK